MIKLIFLRYKKPDYKFTNKANLYFPLFYDPSGYLDFLQRDLFILCSIKHSFTTEILKSRSFTFMTVFYNSVEDFAEDTSFSFFTTSLYRCAILLKRAFPPTLEVS